MVVLWSGTSREYASEWRARFHLEVTALEKNELTLKSLIREGDVVVDTGNAIRRTHWAWSPFSVDAKLLV